MSSLVWESEVDEHAAWNRHVKARDERTLRWTPYSLKPRQKDKS